MRAVEVREILQMIGTEQWGLITTAQARARGVKGTDLARARQAGTIVPVRHGVHRLTGAPEDRMTALRAEWLATDPTRMAYDRYGDLNPVVVTGATAAWVHEIGDLPEEPYEFASPARHQSRSVRVSFHRRTLDPQQVCMVAGLPVATPEATVVELMVQGQDLSLVADALAEAAEQPSFDRDAFQALALGQIGADRVERVLVLAGLDPASQAQHLACSPAGQVLVEEATRQTIQELTHTVERLRGEVSPAASPGVESVRWMAQQTLDQVLSSIPSVSIPKNLGLSEQVQATIRAALAPAFQMPLSAVEQLKIPQFHYGHPVLPTAATKAEPSVKNDPETAEGGR